LIYINLFSLIGLREIRCSRRRSKGTNIRIFSSHVEKMIKMLTIVLETLVKKTKLERLYWELWKSEYSTF